jgi:hypothetical protein
MGRILIIIGAVGGTIVAVLIGFLAYRSQRDTGQDKIHQEVAKLAFQFLLVGILGVLVKFLLDRYHDRAKRVDSLADYRVDVSRKLVSVTNRVRNVPMVVNVHQSLKAYDEQMYEVLDAHRDLKVLRHDVDNLGTGDDNQAFKQWPEIREFLLDMEDYLRKLLREWQLSYAELSKLQLQAEQRRWRRPDVWIRISSQPVFGEMLVEPVAAARVEEGVSNGANSAHLPESEFDREYLFVYRQALGLMRRQIVGKPKRRSQPPLSVSTAAALPATNQKSDQPERPSR